MKNRFYMDNTPKRIYLYQIDLYDEDGEPLFCEPYVILCSTEKIPEDELRTVLKHAAEVSLSFEDYKNYFEACGFIIGSSQYETKSRVKFEIEMKLTTRFETMEDAIQNYPFTASDLLDNEEEDEFMNADMDYSLEGYALEKGIDLVERKKDHIQMLLENDEIIILNQ